jgi:CheY-like chemotaxis protein
LEKIMTKIMLVEDDNHLRDIYEARLIAEGYDIISSGDGEQALAVIVKEKPDLIISDVMMPKISGFDMLDILRSTPEVAHTKVIMMTALSQAEDKNRAASLGADRYLVKSQVTLEDVARTVHEVLGDIPAPTAPAPVATTPAPPTQPVAPVQAPIATTPVQPVNPTPIPSIPTPSNPILSMPTPTAPAPVATTPAPPTQPVAPVQAPIATTPVQPTAVVQSPLISPITPITVQNTVPADTPTTQFPSATAQIPQNKNDAVTTIDMTMTPGTIVNPTNNDTQQIAYSEPSKPDFDTQAAYNEVLASIGASTQPDTKDVAAPNTNQTPSTPRPQMPDSIQ